MQMEKRRKWTLLSLSIPAFLLIFIFMIVPLGNAVKVSFYKWNGYSQKMQWIGLKNYVSIFSDKVFLRSTMNTFIYGFGSTLIQNIAGLSAALLVNRQFRGRNFVRLILYMPIMISGVIMGAIQYYIFNYDNGVLNNLLNLIGIENIYWMQSGIGSVLIITLINSWQAMGFCMLIYLAGLQGIPGELYEAARMDGASGWQSFRRITIPMLTPITFFVSIMLTISCFKVFDLIYTMTEGGPGRATNVLVMHIYQSAFTAYKFGYASAVAMVLFVMVLVITLIQFRMEKKWTGYM